MRADESLPERRGSGMEVLWTAALALIFVTVGYALLPGFIRMAGKSGRIETVEWSDYVLLGTVFPALAAIAGWQAAKLAPGRARIVNIIAAVVILGFVLRLFSFYGITALGISLVLAIIVFVTATRAAGGAPEAAGLAWPAVSIVLLTAVWEAVFQIASWTDPVAWTFQSLRTPVLAIITAVAAAITVTRVGRTLAAGDTKRMRLWWIDLIALLVFLALSFRTTPIVEFYHWGFWVGPIESIRQGGWLLWDVPSQYGFLSVLLPSLIPLRDAWQSLYLVQGILYFIVAAGIYIAIASLRPGIVPRIVALAFTATAFFFRPRTTDLILPAQMTPAGGPMRFFWCYAVLAVLVWRQARGPKVSDRKFVVVGTLVWLASVAWSAESAIYATAGWGGALVIFLIQKWFAAPRGPARRAVARKSLAALALPVAGVIAVLLILTIVYRVFDGHSPDWMGYYEYALLFSGGYSALPVEVRGAVWYHVALFIVSSAVVVRFIARDPMNPKLVVAAGAWGTVWGISSYFVSRSHPVNLLSLVPLLVCATVIELRLLEAATLDRWSRLLAMSSAPLIAMPIVLTLAHGGFPDLLFRSQTPMSELALQVPAMDTSLVRLASAAGMRPDDPAFFVGDGRYVVPRWPSTIPGVPVTSRLAFEPKPYEVINTLPVARRNTYIERFQQRVKNGGWLIQKKSDIDHAYSGLTDVIEQSYTRSKSFENDQWIILRYDPRSPAPPRFP